jgi:Predicted membrane protein
MPATAALDGLPPITRGKHRLESIIALVVLAVLAVPVLLGVLAFSVLGLRRRVQLLEQHVAMLQAGPQPEAACLLRCIDAGRGLAGAGARRTRTACFDDAATAARHPAAGAGAGAGNGCGAATPPPHAERSRRRPEPPGPLQRLLGTARRWFTEGNMPVKVGMLVLLAGVAALLKYASDQGWLNLADRTAPEPDQHRRAGRPGVCLAQAR